MGRKLSIFGPPVKTLVGLIALSAVLSAFSFA